MAIELKGKHTLPLGQQALWDMLNDPAVLAKAIPGCGKMERVGDDVFEVALKLQVASIGGSYTGKIAIAGKQPPQRYRLQLEGQGSIGFAKGEAGFELVADSPAATTVIYDGRAEVGGLVAGVGSRMLSGVSKFLVGQFFKALEKQIAAQVPKAGS
ncbi:MAG TPA: carbon monoxide dehydrogenase subunit G [Burkholderiales bacterium]|nr:carbon monoxide dehydrogenase subunit G [Burkholderiales bacterium]